MPSLVVVAGPNGSGKSTTAPALLQDALKVDEFVNADAIAWRTAGAPIQIVRTGPWNRLREEYEKDVI